MTSAAVSNRPTDSATPATSATPTTTTDSPTAQTQAASSPQPSGALPTSDKAQAASENRPETAGPERADAFLAPAPPPTVEPKTEQAAQGAPVADAPAPNNAPAPLAAGADAQNNTAGAETEATNSHQPPSPTPARSEQVRSEQVAPGKAPIAPEPSAAAGSPAKDAITTAPTEPRQIEQDQRTENSKEQRGTDSDPRVLEMRKEQEQLQRDLLNQRRLVAGTGSEVNRLNAELEDMGVVAGLAGVAGATQKQIETEAQLRKVQQTRADELQQSLSDSERMINDLKQAEQRGRELEKQGHLEQAQQEYNKAQLLRQQHAQMVSAGVVVTTEDYQASTERVRQSLQAADKNLERAETIARTTQTTLIITGATLATGGAALAVGGVAGAVVGVAAGTAYGTVAGGLSSVAEAEAHVAQGNKLRAEAYQDAAQQTAQYAKDSALASAGTVLGIGAAAKLLPAGGAAVATVGQRVIAGAVGGGSNSLLTEGVNISVGLANGTETRDWTQITRDTVINVGVGTIAGAIGGRAGVAKDGQKALTKVAISAVEVTTNAGLGVGGEAIKAAADGRSFTLENAADSASQAIVSGVVGEVVSSAAAHASPAIRKPEAEQQGSEHATTVAEHDQSTAAKKALNADPTGGAAKQYPPREENDSTRVDLGEDHLGRKLREPGGWVPATDAGKEAAERIIKEEYSPPFKFPENMRRKENEPRFKGTDKKRGYCTFKGQLTVAEKTGTAEIYFHEDPTGSTPDSWRINLDINEKVTDVNGTIIKDDKGRDKTQKINYVAVIKKDALAKLAKGEKLDLETDFELHTHKEFQDEGTKLHKYKENQDKGLQGPITDEEADRIADLMDRGHFVPEKALKEFELAIEQGLRDGTYWNNIKNKKG